MSTNLQHASFNNQLPSKHPPLNISFNPNPFKATFSNLNAEAEDKRAATQTTLLENKLRRKTTNKNKSTLISQNAVRTTQRKTTQKH